MSVLDAGDVVLEPQVAAHAEAMFAVLDDPAIYTYEGERPISVTALRHRFTLLESRCSPDGLDQWLNWVVRLRDGEPIGYVQATLYCDQRAAIAYVLASAHWGQGYALQAVRAMRKELVAQYGVGRLIAVYKRANHRSQRLLERLRFTPLPSTAGERLELESDEDAMDWCAPHYVRGPFR